MNYLMYMFCMFIWGLNFIAVKIQGDSLPLEVALLYRSLIAFSLFGVMFIFIFKKLKLNNTNWFTIIGFGLCNFTISYLLLYYGTFYSSAAIVTLIFSMKAILTPIFISMVFKRKISNRIYIGGRTRSCKCSCNLISWFKQLNKWIYNWCSICSFRYNYNVNWWCFIFI